MSAKDVHTAVLKQFLEQTKQNKTKNKQKNQKDVATIILGSSWKGTVKG